MMYRPPTKPSPVSRFPRADRCPLLFLFLAVLLGGCTSNPLSDYRVASSIEPLQLPERVKEERNQHLLKLVNSLAKPKYEALVGTTVQVLVEGPSKTNAERLVGRTSTNKIVVFEGGPDAGRLHGQLLDIDVSHFHNFTLYGTPALVPA